jgi:hypothetical protein
MADFQKLQQWQEAWQTLWKTKGPPSYELTPSGDISNSGWVTELLSGVRSPAREIQRLDRIVREFSDGFDRLQDLGPAVAVFGSARFPEGSSHYNLGVEVGRELVLAGFTVITVGSPGMMGIGRCFSGRAAQAQGRGLAGQYS